MVAIKKFKKLSSPTFNGMLGSEASEFWLEQVERTFNVMQLAPSLRLNMGTHRNMGDTILKSRDVLQHGNNSLTFF